MVGPSEDAAGQLTQMYLPTSPGGRQHSVGDRVRFELMYSFPQGLERHKDTLCMCMCEFLRV